MEFYLAQMKNTFHVKIKLRILVKLQEIIRFHKESVQIVRVRPILKKEKEIVNKSSDSSECSIELLRSTDFVNRISKRKVFDEDNGKFAWNEITENSNQLRKIRNQK